MKYYLVGIILMFIIGCTSTGTASWYGKGFEGKSTSSGYIYDSNQLTCASNEYPFGTVLKVTNEENGKSVVVVVTDRGDFEKLGRKIDLSRAAFLKISTLGHGLVDVKIEVLNEKNIFRYKHGSPRFTEEEYQKYVKDLK